MEKLIKKSIVGCIACFALILGGCSSSNKNSKIQAKTEMSKYIKDNDKSFISQYKFDKKCNVEKIKLNQRNINEVKHTNDAFILHKLDNEAQRTIFDTNDQKLKIHIINLPNKQNKKASRIINHKLSDKKISEVPSVKMEIRNSNVA